MKFNCQDKPKHITWVNSDYAGCRKPRKSTSGGISMFGRRPIKSWATTQGVIALSSGEAEIYSIVNCASISMGLANILVDFGAQSRIQIKTGVFAAKGIAPRSGVGKVRHIEVSQLFSQEKAADSTIQLLYVIERAPIKEPPRPTPPNPG